MRTVTYGAACSLDGFIAGPDEALDWIHFSPDAQAFMTEYLAGVDTMLMGRKTWEFAMRMSGGGGGGGGSEYQGMRSYVFSRTLESLPYPGAELVREDAGEFVRRLKRERGGGICVMGGGNLARSLLEADVIDEVGLNIHPVLLGSGVPLFLDAGRRVKLQLKKCRPIAGGCVLVTYRVRHARGSARSATSGAGTHLAEGRT